MKRFVSLIFVISSLSSHSTETDNFTYRYELYKDNKDQVELLNSWVRASLEEARVEVNSEKEKCNEEDLRKAVKEKFTRFIYSKIESKVMNSKEVHQYKTDVKKSVYKGFGRAFVFNSIASSFLFNNQIIGPDKFSHFFNEGWRYFKEVHIKKKSLRSALKIGHKDEKTIRGKVINGVYSFADLKANLDGMIFFRSLTNKYRTKNDQASYFRCEKNKWVKNRDFYWQDYVDAAYDEGNNCSTFRNDKLQRKFEKNLAKLSAKKGNDYQCPINNSCETMKTKYIPLYGEDIARTFISSVCF